MMISLTKQSVYSEVSLTLACITHTANCFFRNFEIKGPGDRVLIYLTLFISECIAKLAAKMPNSAEGARTLANLAVGSYSSPGEANFPLNSLFETPANRNDADMLRQYIGQLRQEMASRLIPRIYIDGPDRPSKWWLCFSKRKFMGISASLST